jgi:hypothetical protein
VPRFSRRIALSTDLPAAGPYFRPPDFLLERFLVAMSFIIPGKLVVKNMFKGCRAGLLAATAFAVRHQTCIMQGIKIFTCERRLEHEGGDWSVSF